MLRAYQNSQNFTKKNVFDYPDESLQCIKKIGRINRPIFDFVF